MDFAELKKKTIRDTYNLGDQWGKIFTFVDFGNVNKWYEDDPQDEENRPLKEGQSLNIGLEKLKDFLSAFSEDIRFYYGHDLQRPNSLAFLRKTRHVFGSNRVFTKPIQWVRHYLTNEEIPHATRSLFTDKRGTYIKLPKCNFDVEMSVDALKTIDKYDTFFLLSGDGDFKYLNTHLRNKGKKIILLKRGNITKDLRDSANLVLSASDIKRHVVIVEERQR